MPVKVIFCGDRMARRLYRRWDKKGKFPFWARWIWPRIHWCSEFDEMLVLGDHGDLCCSCVQWPPGWEEDQERRLAEGAAAWAEEEPF